MRKSEITGLLVGLLSKMRNSQVIAKVGSIMGR